MDTATTEIRCSTALFRGPSVLLVHRTGAGADDWVLPGGSPREGESMAACARREVLEETGLSVDPVRVAFVLESAAPRSRRRIVDLVFAGAGTAAGQDPRCREPGLEPQFVPFDRLAALDLRPPLAGHLPSLYTHGDRYAPYLGNLWRPVQTLQDTGPKPSVLDPG
ncbi:NUDIX hydrolase [Streptacidiphilus sp. 4-A2]|nr:NUDIX hydrolase [Streptacidiphilus sp. 4-A2]